MKWREIPSRGQALACIVAGAWLAVAGYYCFKAASNTNYGLAAIDL